MNSEEINPVNQSVENIIATAVRDQKANQRGNQAYTGDWLNIPNIVVYISATTIGFSNANIDPRTYFSVGSIIRLKQGGAFKYFFVTLVTATTITLNGGSDYTLVNSTITDLGKSLVGTTATGFPGSLNYDCNPTAIIGTLTVNPNPLIGVKKGSFFMIGNFVFFDAAVNGASLTNGTNVRVAVPVLQNIAAFQVADRIICDGLDNFATSLSMAKMDQTANPQLTLYLYPSFGGYSATTNGFGFYIKYSYRLDPF